MNRTKKDIFIVFVIVVLFSIPGFCIRFSNDMCNKAVVTFIGYEDIEKHLNMVNSNKEQVLEDIRDSGITHILIKTQKPEQVEEKLKHIKKNKFKAVLSLNNEEFDCKYAKDIDKLINKFNIKYIIFEGSKVVGYPNNLEEISNIINKNNIIVGIKEKYTQIGIEEQYGLNELMKTTDYSVNRLYKLTPKQLQEGDSSYLFYKLMRGVIDRGIRFVYVQPLENPNFTAEQNFINTIEGTKEFSNFIKENGYNTNRDIIKLNSKILGQEYYFVVAIGILLTGILYLKYLLDIEKMRVYAILASGIVIVFVIQMVVNIDITKYLALMASIIYPCLVNLFLLRSVENKERLTLMDIVYRVLIFAGISTIGGCVVVSVLNSIIYTMNIDIFRGVRVSFIVPLVIYIVNYYCVFIKNVEIQKIKEINGIGVLKIVGAALMGVFFVCIYVSRSGSFGIIKATQFELDIREFLEKTMVVRPRFKEFVIGYPMLIAFLHFNNTKIRSLHFVLGMASVIGSISIVNSFCHVFTPINASLIRTANGLVLGIFIGGAILGTMKIIEKCKNYNI